MLDPVGAAHVQARIPALTARLRRSASGFVLMQKFGSLDRKALRLLINAGEAEIIKTALGHAYRLKNEDREGHTN